ncbi:MAG: putative lipid II flippase FtsW [Spirochaetes bacterium]|nr:putative lipid II flippase FtsW [Spirochaetota bacterium]
MKRLTHNRPTIEITLLACIILLIGIGYGFLYSASKPIAEKYHGNAYYYLIKQGIYLLFGIIAFFMGLFIDYDIYKRHIKSIVLLTITLLVITLIPGIGREVNGARRWLVINLFFDKFQFQPSELAKLSVVFYLSSVMSNKEEYIKDFYKGVLPPLIFVSFISFLVLMGNDFSTTFLFLLVCLVVFFLSGARILTLFMLSMIGLISTVIMIIFAPYRTKRIFAFLNPWEDPLGSGWHYIQSMKCFALGKWFGRGIGESIQKNSNLPEAHTDYIFAIIGEEGGVFISLIIIILYAIFVIVGFNIARRAIDKYSFILASGITVFVFIQAMINIGVVLGVLPATGITLPFVSSGGTSMVVYLYASGILMNISIRSKRENRLEE